MTPRTPIGETAMTSAERIQRSRWINKTEEAAINLLDLLDDAPQNLARQPEIPAELVQKLIPYINAGGPSAGNARSRTSTERFLKLGNGNQVNNKKKGLKFTAHYLNATALDKRTIQTEQWGRCHFASYTHPNGAMISTPNSEDQDYGGKEWHNNDHIIMFRETDDGHCIIYICEIKPLFDKRTIGHHGVKWKDIEKVASYTKVLETSEVIKVYAELEQI